MTEPSATSRQPARSSTAFRDATPARRDVLKAGAAALALGTARLRPPAPAAAQEATDPAADVCMLTPELTEGPFYVEDALLRRDVTEGKPGAPLRLRVAVTDTRTCVPLANAAVDIWHCDAQGFYSGVSGNNPGGGGDAAAPAEAAEETFLRGVQLTDADGIAEFDSIYPGWYRGRTPHIHLKVHVGGAPEDGAYDGGHVAHTGQVFFDDAISDAVYATAPAYAGRPNAERTRNDQDNILGDHVDEPGFVLKLTPLANGDPVAGFVGEITFGVNPDAAPPDVGFGGGPGGPPPA